MMGYQQLSQDDETNNDDDDDACYQQLESDNEQDEQVVDMKAPVSIKISSANSIDPGIIIVISNKYK
jgi:hypothetical protein